MGEAEVVEREEEEMPQPTRAIVPKAKAPEMWEASPLAVMDEETFEKRVTLARLERDRLATVQRAVMKEGVDYGKVPGTEKPTLLKPGAEVLNKMAGLVAAYREIRTVGDGEAAPTIHYLVHCYLHKYDESGPVVAEGLGSCNSWERKYRWRSGAVCPSCGEQLRVSKNKEEWYCWAKTGGCGATFPLDQIDAGSIENSDPFDLDNTLLKMARKRAQADATLTAHAASGLFTQDVEDFQDQQGSKPQAQKKADPRPALLRETYEHWKERATQLHLSDEDRDRLWREAFEAQQVESSKDATIAQIKAVRHALDGWLPEEAEGSQDEGEWTDDEKADNAFGQWEKGEQTEESA